MSTATKQKGNMLICMTINLLFAAANLALYVLQGKWWSIAVVPFSLAVAGFNFYVYLKWKSLDA